MVQLSETQLATIRLLLNHPEIRKGFAPLSERAKIAVYIDESGPASVYKENGNPTASPTEPTRPDLTFRFPGEALHQLTQKKYSDLGDFGVALIELMATGDTNLKVRANVHIGLIDFVRNGYLGMLPLGGAKVMKCLAEKGLGSISQIRETIAKFRSKE